jgi:hypothetical protein
MKRVTAISLGQERGKRQEVKGKSTSVRRASPFFLFPFAFCLATGLGAQQSETVDVSGYPPEVQKQYRLMAAKCSRCHDLSRPLTARYTTEAQWRDMVARMARKPGAGISRRDQMEIIAFLVFHQKARSGQKPTTAGAATPAPAPQGAAPAVTPSPATEQPAAAEPLIPTPPAARAEGTTAGGGLRVEVEALPAQPIMIPADGRWTTQAPGNGENLFLAVRLFDETTGEKVPYATIRARVGGNPATAARPLRPLFGGKGFQYGGNFVAPAGDLEVSLEVEPPALARVNDDGRRWTSPLNLKLTLRGR